jgi:HK97 family phage portal protein
MFNWLKPSAPIPAPDTKTSRAAASIALLSQNRPVWSGRDYGVLAREGYMRNAIAHRCVRLVATSAATLPVVLKSRGKGQNQGQELLNHPLLTLLSRPNPREGGSQVLEKLYGHLMIAGNAYLEMVALEGTPRELYALRPDRMRVVPGNQGWPAFYEYQVGAQTIRYAQEGDIPPILHIRQFHPLDDHYGLSPMEAAQVALDLHNTASDWNKALLDNAARPSGALVYANGSSTNMSDEQFQRLKQELEENYQGAINAGRPLLLEGGLDWKPLSLSPRDMDFLEARNNAAREIALALGVPPLMLGLAGDNTYGNFMEANRAFYRSTIIPLVRHVLEAFSHWLEPAYGEELILEPDLDAIEALAPEREALWRRVNAADFLSADEKREAVGYGRG